VVKKILLWGNSIFLAGLALALQHQGELEVLCTAANLLEAAFYLKPDMIIVDLSDPRCGEALTLLREYPSLGLIGINPLTGAVTVLSGQVHLTQTLEEVTRAITDF